MDELLDSHLGERPRIPAVKSFMREPLPAGTAWRSGRGLASWARRELTFVRIAVGAARKSVLAELLRGRYFRCPKCGALKEVVYPKTWAQVCRECGYVQRWTE